MKINWLQVLKLKNLIKQKETAEKMVETLKKEVDKQKDKVDTKRLGMFAMANNKRKGQFDLDVIHIKGLCLEDDELGYSYDSIWADRDSGLYLETNLTWFKKSVERDYIFITEAKAKILVKEYIATNNKKYDEFFGYGTARKNE